MHAIHTQQGGQRGARAEWPTVWLVHVTQLALIMSSAREIEGDLPSLAFTSSLNIAHGNRLV